jgi:hypothetical protein
MEDFWFALLREEILMPRKKQPAPAIVKPAVVEKPAPLAGHLAAFWFTLTHIFVGTGVLGGVFAKVGCHTQEGVFIHGAVIAIKLITDAFVVCSYHRNVRQKAEKAETVPHGEFHDEWPHGEPPF